MISDDDDVEMGRTFEEFARENNLDLRWKEGHYTATLTSMCWAAWQWQWQYCHKRT